MKAFTPLLIPLTALLALAQQPSNPKAAEPLKQWEHCQDPGFPVTSTTTDNEVIVSRLNIEGLNGWELVTFVIGNSKSTATYKRLKQGWQPWKYSIKIIQKGGNQQATLLNLLNSQGLMGYEVVTLAFGNQTQQDFAYFKQPIAAGESSTLQPGTKTACPGPS